MSTKLTPEQLAEYRNVLRMRNLTTWEAEAVLSHCTALEEELKAAEDLAYIGEHHFPELTWKARCMETVAELKAAQEERDGLRESLEGSILGWAELDGAVKRAAINDFRAQLVEAVQAQHDYFWSESKYAERAGQLERAHDLKEAARGTSVVVDLISTFEAGEVK